MTELLVVLAVLLAVAAVLSRNRFVRQQALVEESARQVDVELRRRADLVPALVEVVQAQGAADADLAASVLQALSATGSAGGAAVSGRAVDAPRDGRADAAAERALELRLAQLVAQTRPEAAGLLAALADTEDRLAAARRFHNGNVRALNARVESWPSSLVAQATGVQPAEGFALGDGERALLELPPALDLRPDRG